MNGGNCLPQLVAAWHTHKKYSAWKNPVYRVQFKIGVATLDPLLPPSLLGRMIVFFLRVELGENGKKATLSWLTAYEKPSNIQGIFVFSVGHGNQMYWKHFQSRICMMEQVFVVQLSSGEMMTTSPSDFKESKTLVYAGRILSWLFSGLSWVLAFLI